MFTSENDYILQQIQLSGRFLAKLLGKDGLWDAPDEQPEGLERGACDSLRRRLLDLLAQGELNRAENLLYAEADPPDAAWMEAAVELYARLNELSDDELELHDYSREEIGEGLQMAANRYGAGLPGWDWDTGARP